GSDQERVQLRDQLQQAREQLDRALSQTEQLRQEIPLATQPLLKQIATLQALLKSQTEKSESTESKLLRKLAEAKKRFETRRSSMQTSESNLVDAQKANEELKVGLRSFLSAVSDPKYFSRSWIQLGNKTRCYYWRFLSLERPRNHYAAVSI
ncbi:hypothetical protein BVRB_036060, partial [Beta vulgaris subsp. vulgaris]